MMPDTWVRATNPRCAWLRLLLLPSMLVPLWFGQMLLAMLVMMLWMMVPLVFRKPSSDDPWITRAALGGQIWRGRPRADLLVPVLWLATVAALGGGMWASRSGSLPATVAAGLLGVVFPLLLYVRTAALYGQHRDAAAARR